MSKIKSNINSLNKHLFLGFSFFIFSLIASVYWGLTYAEDITPLLASSIPVAPTGLTYNITTSSVNLHWVDNSSNEDKFNISRRLSTSLTSSTGSNSWTSIGLITVPNTTTYTDTTVTPGNYYDYSVEACLSNVGCSAASVVERVFIPSTNLNGVGSAACTDIQLKLNDGKTSYTIGDTVNYTWNCSPTGAIGNIYILLQKPDGTISNYNNTSNATTSTNGFSTSNLLPGSYTLKACLSTSCTTSGGIVSGQSFNVVAPVVSAPVVPAAPTNLGIYGGVTLTSSFKSIPLVWIDRSTNEDRFYLERKLSDSSTWSRITIPTGPNIVSFTDSSVTAGVSYDYRIKACLIDSCSDFSVLEKVSIPLASATNTGVTPSNVATTPTAPSSFSKEIIYTTAGLSNIKIAWRDNSNNEIKFLIKRKLSSETAFPSNSRSVGTNITDFLDTDSIKQGTTYDYSLSACSTDTLCSSPIYMYGVYVTSPTVVTPTTVQDIPVVVKTTPPSPTELKKDSAYSIDTLSYIIIRWAYNFDNDIQFIIKRKLNNIAASVYTKIGSIQKGVNYFKDSTIQPAVSYDYSVSACDSSGLCSNPVEIKGISSPSYILTPPNAPTGLTKEINSLASSPTVTIRWKDNSADEDKFILERRSNINQTFTQVGEIIRANIISFVDKIEPGIYYEYRIKACSINSCSVYSNLLEKVYIPKQETVVPKKDEIVSPKESLPAVVKPVVVTPIENNVVSETSKNPINEDTSTTTVNIPEVVNILSGNTVEEPKKAEQEINLIYKDTNNDGISDYDSKYVYNIDPAKASVVSIYEGKKINASDKILLGFDPTKTELVKTVKEEPLVSKAAVVSTYKVKEIELKDKNTILIKGQALPNSFITIYIYSTPIIVTIKTDSRGEWQYLLDKELENGDHTVYTATVNNTGNIVAQSSPYSFVKTAEAVTLRDLPVAEASTTVEKPGLIDSKNIFVIAILLFMTIGVTLILVGLFSKKEIKS